MAACYSRCGDDDDAMGLVAAADTIHQLERENAALRDDKKLVDWLDENEASAVFEPGDPEVGLFPAWSVYYNDRELPVVHADLRAAINAARAKEGGAT
jgi:hypothetical protein